MAEPPGERIVDVINRVTKDGGTVISCEFFPARTASGVAALLRRVEETVLQLRPHFVAVTWRAQFKDEDLWLAIGSQIQKNVGVPVLMHLTCHRPVADLKRILGRCRERGLRNILALRGDPPVGAASWRPAPGCLLHAQELVELIRREHGDYFCVAVGGYPEVHLESHNSPELPPSEQARALDLERLRAKCASGADFVVTQFFYDARLLLRFLEAARAAGVAVPIIPGYMPIQSYDGFSKFVAWCRAYVPPSVRADLDAIRDDDAAVKEYGERLAVATIRELHAAGVRAVHFFTLNLTGSVQRILTSLGLAPLGVARASSTEDEWSPDPAAARPIFWANRAHVGHSRAPTEEFPNGRFTLSSSPAFGELSDYYLSAKRPKLDRRGMWGTPQSVDDVARVFASFIEGNRAVTQLPWCDSAPAAETSHISDALCWLNKAGVLTVNSQPRINGVASNDPRFGWGGPDGVCFQKAYVEAWVSPELFERLLGAFPRFPSLSFHAINARGEERLNVSLDRANTVTWGVWPGREVLQPTVVDPRSFRVWAQEAFGLWLTQWQALYSDDAGGSGSSRDSAADARARVVLQDIHDSWWLLSVVDNDYVSDSADVFGVFREVVLEGLAPDALRARVRELEAEAGALRETHARLREEHLSTAGELALAVEAERRTAAENAQLRQQLLVLRGQQQPGARHGGFGAPGAAGSALLPLLSQQSQGLLLPQAEPGLGGAASWNPRCAAVAPAPGPAATVSTMPPSQRGFQW